MEPSFRPTRGNSPQKAECAQQLRREMTPEERILWQELRQLRAHGFAFRRQQVIAGFIADFYCHAARLVVEVDGGVHETQRDYDAERDQVFMGYNLQVLRVANDAVRESLPAVIRRITELASARAGTPQSGLPFPSRGEGAGG